MNKILTGKHVIRYEPAAFTYRQILEALAENKNQGSFTFISPEAPDAPDEPLHPNLPNITSIALVYPVLLSDKRWDSLHLTASSLFLGSALTDAGFRVTVKKQILPVSRIDSQLLARDLIGLTLFEDLFPQTQAFLEQLKNRFQYTGIIAAGGPLITLNPFQAAYHLPEINLFVRGEAELVFPGLIQAINARDIKKLLTFHGFLFQVPGLIVISGFDEINRPADFNGFHFNLGFLDNPPPDDRGQTSPGNVLAGGLEINVSRGCKRSCTFCSTVQGRHLRQLPVSRFEELLTQFSAKLERFAVQSPQARTININDDDILQDPEYAEHIFQTIKAKDFRLWGIQTSINSFFTGGDEIDKKIFGIITDPALFVEDKPLVWAGTDAFLKERGKRLGKHIPPREHLIRLVDEFEKRRIANYHYWISSDPLSDWEEFTREFELIHELLSRFRFFGLLPHAPFLVPYSTTPLYRRMLQSPDLKQRIKTKKILAAKQEIFAFPLVEKAETAYRHLNRLLNNETLNDRPGFFDDLRGKDYTNAWITLYNFLKQERMEAIPDSAERLRLLEQSVADGIAKMI